MATQKQILEKQDRERDAAFNKALHGDSATAQGGFRAMMAKGGDAQKAAVDEYFKHWDNQAAKDETEETRAVSSDLPPTLSSMRLSLRAVNHFPWFAAWLSARLSRSPD